jgi:peptidoglycan/xylan/chitin deacetylase (PgdA/CDA1 family)
MRSLKKIIKGAMATSLGWRLSAPLRPGGVAVLMYHRITRPSDPFPGLELSRFRAQMQWLKRRCAVIAPEDLPQFARDSSRTRPAVLVTFDDGYRDYYDNAYPVLDELRIPAVVFLATSFMDNGGMIWTDALHWAAGATRNSTATLPWDRTAAFDLRAEAGREALLHQCKRHLKDAPDVDRRRWMDMLLAELGVAGREGEIARQMMNWHEVRATARLTRCGGHTHTHPIMSQLEAPELEREVRVCRDRIATETGVAPRYFAYPNGRAADFTEAAKAVLRRHGFDFAFTTIEGMNARDADLLALRRIPTGAATLADFAWLVSGR